MMVHTESFQSVVQNLVTREDIFPTSVNRKTANYLYKLTRKLKPEIVVELGCYHGFSSIHIAEALRQNESGSLFCFDLNVHHAAQTVKRARLERYVRFIEGDSSVNGEKFLNTDPGRAIDLLFIDGDHTRRGCYRDFTLFSPRVKIGGCVIFHDIYPSICGWRGPRFVLDRLIRNNSNPLNTQYTVDENSSIDRFGLAVCKKISDGKLSVYTEMGGGILFRLRITKLFSYFEQLEFKARTSPMRARLIEHINRFRSKRAV